MSDEEVAELWEELKSLETECETLESIHRDYIKKLENVNTIQAESAKNIKAYLAKCVTFKEKMKERLEDGLSSENANKAQDVIVEIGEMKGRAQNMLNELPRTDSGFYLGIILGSLNISLMNKREKYQYKVEYENFKLSVQVIAFVVATFAFAVQHRAVDACFHFLLVWYYCTLTIRESILRVNGSRIKGWWMLHHYVSTILCGISLTWPDGACYQAFRRQFLFFSLYLSIVQGLQSQYQRGCLYRLHSLGQRHSMDITVDGFQSWMFKGLTFLLPFLFIAYGFQMYNAYRLIRIYYAYGCFEWQVVAIAGLFSFLSLGNTWTTGRVCWKKLQEKETASTKRKLLTKYSISEIPDRKKD